MAKLKSPGLTEEKKFHEEASKLQLSSEQAEAIYFYQERARKAYEQREKNWEYFDGLTYTQDYYLNRQAANTYLRPKKNDAEVRVNTGTTEKKIEVVQNELLSLSLEPEVRAFDQNDLAIEDLGEQMQDVVERTNEIEKDQDLWSDAVVELLTQRAVFIEERWVDDTHRDNVKGKIGVRNTARAQKFLISGLKVFLGDISIPWYKINEQPYIVKYDRVHYKTAEKMFKYKADGSVNPMWQHVSKGQPSTNVYGIFDLRIGRLEQDEVEILTYMSYNDDEYMRIVNGVPIDEVGTKLPWEYEGYNIKMFTLKRMSTDFAYGKPLTASAKTLQSLNNETIRLLIHKFRQAIKPPLGVKSGKVFSKDIWAEGAVTQGVGKDDFERLIDHQGITESEANFQDKITQMTEEFIGAGSLQQGIATKGQQTATEIQQLQKQFSIQLGNAVGAVMAMKRDLTYLRLYNILEHVVKPTGKKLNPMNQKIQDIFMQFTREETDLGAGRRGQKRVIFTDEDVLPDIDAEEKFYEKYEKPKEKVGQDIRYYFINVKKLKEIAVNWFITVNQSMKDSEALDKVMFTDSLQQATAVATLSGRPLNGDALVQEFGQVWKRKDWFQREAPQLLAAMAGGVEGGSPAKDLIPDRQQKPGINTLEGKLS